MNMKRISLVLICIMSSGCLSEFNQSEGDIRSGVRSFSISFKKELSILCVNFKPNGETGTKHLTVTNPNGFVCLDVGDISSIDSCYRTSKDCSNAKFGLLVRSV